MSQFISWIEHGGKLYYLTKKQLDSKKGKKLVEYCGCVEDLIGHGAIRQYYGFSGGFEKECVDFSTPDNFPAEIVSALKRGLFQRIGIPLGILTPEALDEYQRIGQTAWAEYQNIKQSALEKYQRMGLTAFWELFKNLNNKKECWR